MSQPVGCIQKPIGYDDSFRSFLDRWIKFAPIRSWIRAIFSSFPLAPAINNPQLRSSCKSFIFFWLPHAKRI